jgi:hypothetical protein
MQIKDRLNDLQFSYERSGNRTGVAIAAVGQNLPSARGDAQSARSAQLMQGALGDDTDGRLVLPTTSDSSLSYIRFKCAKGHEWKAMPGSFVSSDCPVCSSDKNPLMTARRGRERQRRVTYKGSVWRQLVACVLQRGGSLVNPLPPKKKLIWSSHVEVECGAGHTWEASCSNLVNYGTWCPQCLRDKRALREQDLVATAEYFGGQFLGFAVAAGADADAGAGAGAGAGSSSKKSVPLGERTSRWKCSEGHMFTRRANHIRRRSARNSATGSPPTRRCAWCSDCARLTGKEFVWEPESVESNVAGWRGARKRLKAPRFRGG